MYASSFGNCTAKAICKKHPVGHEIRPKHRFVSQNNSEYVPKNFRRFSKYKLLSSYPLFLTVDKPEMEPRKDYDDYSSFVNDSFNVEKDKVLQKTVDMDRKRFSMDRVMNRTEVKTYSVTRGS